MPTLLLIFIAIFVTACSALVDTDGQNESIEPVESVVNSEETISGSRLRAYYRVTEDGAKEYIFGRWYDSELMEDCSILLTEDNKERCIPTATIMTNNLYSDSSCSVKLTITNSPPSNYVTEKVLVNSSRGEIPVYSVYYVGEVYTGEIAYRINETSNECEIQSEWDYQENASWNSFFRSFGYEFHYIGNRVQDDNFVEVTYKHD